MSKKFNKKQLKKMNKTVSGGAVAKVTADCAPVVFLAPHTKTAGKKVSYAYGDAKAAKKVPTSVIKLK